MSEKTKKELENEEKQVPDTPQEEKKSLIQRAKESEKLQKFGEKAKPILKGLALFAGGIVVGALGDRFLGYEDEYVEDADYEETGNDYSSDDDE